MVDKTCRGIAEPRSRLDLVQGIRGKKRVECRWQRVGECKVIALKVVAFTPLAFDRNGNHHTKRIKPGLRTVAVDIFHFGWREHTVVEANANIWIVWIRIKDRSTISERIGA